MNVWLLLAIGYISSILVMIAVWFLQRRLGDAGIVDVVWSYGVGLLSLFYAIFSAGDGTRRIIVATLAMIWAIRLGTHVLYRVIKFEEDGRYINFKEKHGDKAQQKLFWFYQAQDHAHLPWRDLLAVHRGGSDSLASHRRPGGLLIFGGLQVQRCLQPALFRSQQAPASLQVGCSGCMGTARSGARIW